MPSILSFRYSRAKVIVTNRCPFVRVPASGTLLVFVTTLSRSWSLAHTHLGVKDVDFRFLYALHTLHTARSLSSATRTATC